MGLTKSSVGICAVDEGLKFKATSDEKIIALAGNPNVGKSTVFNALTGMNQHTGNWSGKTVACASGSFKSEKGKYLLVDIPGTYSLMAHSPEEEVARNFICFGKPDAVVVVCDATCLERNMNLILQTLEISKKTIVCINLMDEAEKKGIKIDTKLLSLTLGVPVVAVTARKKKSLENLISAIDRTVLEEEKFSPFIPKYDEDIESAIEEVQKTVARLNKTEINNRWLSLRLLSKDYSVIEQLDERLGEQFLKNPTLFAALDQERQKLSEKGKTELDLCDSVAAALVSYSREICTHIVRTEKKRYANLDRTLDKLLTGKYTAYPFMLLLLSFIFWLTITGANYPSSLLTSAFAALGEKLDILFTSINMPPLIKSALLDGVYKVLSSVIAVMLPPMAIFFPLFTLLEDSGYLPRIAYNLDRPFKKCNACGKQALTICMGFGCNAAGIVGCRIIDSPRERLLATITNSFVPCNGRFPMLISVITMFFCLGIGGSSAVSVLLLLSAILFSLGITFLSTKLLSSTVLKGLPSSFILELPPYRKPQIGKVLVRSVFDRTLFVLGRAAAVAAPAGLLLWLASNIKIGDMSIFSHFAAVLEPIGSLMGLDGIILLAFIFGFPANEIVIPIIIMGYLQTGVISDLSSLEAIKALFVSNGWGIKTAICFIIFTLFHWPCSTTILTIKKETASLKWTVLSAILPTLIGFLLCVIVNLIFKAFL